MLGFFYLLILQEHILKRKGFNSKPFAQPLNVEFGMCFLLTGWWRGGNLHVWPHPISPASMLELLAGARLLPRLDVPGGSMTDAAAGPGSRFLGAHRPTWRPVLSTLGAGYAFWAIVDPLFFPPVPWSNCGTSGKEKKLWWPRFGVYFLFHVGNHQDLYHKLLLHRHPAPPTPAPTPSLLPIAQ